MGVFGSRTEYLRVVFNVQLQKWQVQLILVELSIADVAVIAPTVHKCLKAAAENQLVIGLWVLRDHWLHHQHGLLFSSLRLLHQGESRG